MDHRRKNDEFGLASDDAILAEESRVQWGTDEARKKLYIGICRSSTFILFYLALFGLDFAPFNLRQIKNPSSPDPILIQSISQVFLGPLELKTAIVDTASNRLSNYPSFGIGSM